MGWAGLPYALSGELTVWFLEMRRTPVKWFLIAMFFSASGGGLSVCII